MTDMLIRHTFKKRIAQWMDFQVLLTCHELVLGGGMHGSGIAVQQQTFH